MDENPGDWPPRQRRSRIRCPAGDCAAIAERGTSKFAVARLYDAATRRTCVQFLEEVLIVVPYKLHTILTAPLVVRHWFKPNGGIRFAEQPHNRNTIYSRKSRFDMICDANKIEHRLTRPNHPWSQEDQKTVQGTVRGIVFPNGGQVGRIPLRVCRQTVAGQRNRTIKDATVKRYHYDSHEQLRVQHGARTNGAACFTLDLFIDACTHARRLNTLNGLTPTQVIWKEWQARPDLF